MAAQSPENHVPKHAQLSATLEHAITSGEYPAGAPIPSERRLAARFRVAPMTVRRAVGTLVARGILERRHGSGTYVRAASPGTDIGMLIFHMLRVDAGSLAEMEMAHLRDLAEQQGRRLRPMLMIEPLPPPEQVADELWRMGIAAVGLLGFLNSDLAFVRRISERFPCVLYNKRLVGLSMPCAKPDAAKAMRLAVDWLAGRGRTRLGLVLPNTDNSFHLEKLAAFEAELTLRGCVLDERFVCENADAWDEQSLRSWFAGRLEGERPLDGVIVPQREHALALSALLAERGSALGRAADVVVMRSDDYPGESADPWPRLVFQHRLIAREASRLLLDLAAGRLDPRSAPVIQLAPELMLPGSGSADAQHRKGDGCET